VKKSPKFLRTDDGKLDYAIDDEANSLIVAIARDGKPGEHVKLMCQTITFERNDGQRIKVVRVGDTVIGANFFFSQGVQVKRQIAGMLKPMADAFVHTIFTSILDAKELREIPTSTETFGKN
jgi:hypothetical protein